MLEQRSSVGVIDKAVAVLRSCSPGPTTLAQLVDDSGLPRATAHRLAAALVAHGLLRSTAEGYQPGPLLAVLSGSDAVAVAAPDVLRRLRDSTGLSAQLYRRDGDRRVCVAAVDVEAGLRDTVPVGARLPMTAGSAALALLTDDGVPRGAAFTRDDLAAVRHRGWAATVGQREPGVASVSAPIRGPAGQVVAAVSVSGPAAVTGPDPGRRFGAAVTAAASSLSTAAGTVAIG